MTCSLHLATAISGEGTGICTANLIKHPSRSLYFLGHFPITCLPGLDAPNSFSSF